MDEGYIKFKAIWEKSPAMPLSYLKNLNRWRDRLYSLGLIGAYENGIGFGNISERFDEGSSFLVSGSGTGNLDRLNGKHYAQVTGVDVQKNSLHCQGPIVASSESMSHAMIYRECPWVHGVIHVHNLELWIDLLHKVPTTDKAAPYGSPEMAFSILDLLSNTDLKRKKIFVMEGHEEGIFTFGETLDEAGNVLLRYFEDMP
jgi:ribulose-5-phosphate 4-epimerase/fuculose-1-phosphate aldolase